MYALEKGVDGYVEMATRTIPLCPELILFRPPGIIAIGLMAFAVS